MKDEVWINPMYKGKKGVKLDYVIGECDAGKRAYYISKMERIMLPYLKDFNETLESNEIIVICEDEKVTGYLAYKISSKKIKKLNIYRQVTCIL